MNMTTTTTPTRKLYVTMRQTGGSVWLVRDRRAKREDRLIGPYTTTANAKRAAAALGLTVRG